MLGGGNLARFAEARGIAEVTVRVLFAELEIGGREIGVVIVPRAEVEVGLLRFRDFEIGRTEPNVLCIREQRVIRRQLITHDLYAIPVTGPGFSHGFEIFCLGNEFIDFLRRKIGIQQLRAVVCPFRMLLDIRFEQVLGIIVQAVSQVDIYLVEHVILFRTGRCRRGLWLRHIRGRNHRGRREVVHRLSLRRRRLREIFFARNLDIRFRGLFGFGQVDRRQFLVVIGGKHVFFRRRGDSGIILGSGLATLDQHQ